MLSSMNEVDYDSTPDPEDFSLNIDELDETPKSKHIQNLLADDETVLTLRKWIKKIT